MPTALINVSNRLPVTITDSGIKKSSGGLVAALEGLSKDEYSLNWLGWPGGEIPPEKQKEVERVLREQNCTPVFLSADEAEAHYEGFANSSVWPLLHYMPPRFRYESPWWDAYRDVNQRFADKVLSVAKADELVWVHDYQLMLLPAMLKAARPELRVGFFLHTPFPSYEVFRCHPRREDLVAGMLGADLVGFHTYSYLRHFRSAVLRLLGIESDINAIRHEGQTTSLGVFPIGINAHKFEEELDSPAFRAEFGHLAETYAGTQVVVSVERLDYTKGIINRLDAIELFLEHCENRDRVKFVFVSVPSRENVGEYKELREEVEYRIGRLNGKYATLHTSPIRFIHGSVNFTELCALYALADVALVTPLIDGMNLVAKEFVAAQRDAAAAAGGAQSNNGHGARAPGVLVLSEFAGAAEELFSALLVNPYDTQAVADAIGKGLAMPADERRGRMRPMRDRVMSFDAEAWARSFIGDLSARRPEAVRPVGDGVWAAGDRLHLAIRDHRRVAMFLDYDGTLREIVRDPAAARPTPEVRRVLDRLRELPDVDVTIVSGRTPEDLESFLGEYETFGLVAEHGAAIRPPRAHEWEQLDRNVTYAWKEPVLKLLRAFEQSTPGTHVEEKRTSLVWHYRRADPEFGEWKARQLMMELSGISSNEPLTVRHGKKIVEVTSAHVNKGAAVKRLLSERTYDLVLIAGDDTTDESMFLIAVPDPDLITIHVGISEDTHAKYRLPNPAAFRQFLLAAVTLPAAAAATVG
jgi:trehalose 6-phosphate synthase/phosphatase